MPINSFKEFSEMHLSVLQEIGNMGSGNAATSLSNMISSATDISVPQIKILAAAQAAAVTDMLSSRTAAYLITISGDIKGSMLLVMPFEFIERLVGTYFPGVSVTGKESMDEMVLSVVQETVNIIAASYANNLAELSGMMVDISVPESVTSPSAKILAVNTADPSTVCFISNTIEISDVKKNFNLLFFPELESIQAFMGKLGVEC